MSITGEEFQRQRRALMKAVAGLIAGGGVLHMVGGQQATDEPQGLGKPGDFDFLAGDWKIKNRRRKPAGEEGWDEFEGESTCWTVLGGVGSIEELRIPARDFSGIGIRLLDVEKRIWSDFWVNGKSGVLTTPGQTGNFADGVGTFNGNWIDGENLVLVKGVWDQITPKTCRWYQATSRDNGANWEENWIMHWERQ